MEVIHPRSPGIDISKKDAKVCVRVQGRGSKPTTSTVTTHPSMTASVLNLKEQLLAEGVTLVVMEATGDYWRAFYYVLEDGLNVMLVNAYSVKNVPGRKADVSDAAWLADLGAHGLVRASFVPRPIRELRQLTRTRTIITAERRFSADSPCFDAIINHTASNQTVSGVRVRWNRVWDVTLIRRPESLHR